MFKQRFLTLSVGLGLNKKIGIKVFCYLEYLLGFLVTLPLTPQSPCTVQLLIMASLSVQNLAFLRPMSISLALINISPSSLFFSSIALSLAFADLNLLRVFKLLCWPSKNRTFCWYLYMVLLMTLALASWAFLAIVVTFSIIRLNRFRLF